MSTTNTMRRIPILPRILAALLILALALPNSAYALRQTGLEESDGKDKPKAQLISALTSPFVSTPILSSSPISFATVSSAAGMEEKDLNSISAEDLEKILAEVLKISEPEAKELAEKILHKRQEAPFQDWSQFRGNMKGILSKEQVTALKNSSAISIVKPSKSIRSSPTSTKSQAESPGESISTPALSKWAQGHVLLGLKKFEKSGFSDWSGLIVAARALPVQDQDEWKQIISEIQVSVGTWKLGPEPVDDAIRLLQLLNEGWFVRRNVILLPGRVIESAADLVGTLKIATILEQTNYELDGQSVPVYLVTAYPLGQTVTTAYYPEGFVLFDLNSLRRESELKWSLSKMLRQMGKVLGLSPLRSAVAELFVERTLREYANPAQYQPVQFQESLYEELRHALDFRRTERAAKRKFLAKDVEYYEYFVQTHLRSESRIRKVLWDKVVLPGFSPQDPMYKSILGETIMELSGELTKTFFARDPAERLGGWLSRQLQDSPTSSGDAMTSFMYAEVGYVALLLLIEEMGVASIPWESDAWRSLDYGQIAAWARAIAEQPPEKIRLAVKRFYESNYNSPIDEAPFPKISRDESDAKTPIAAGVEEKLDVTRRGFLEAVAALGAAPITRFVGMFENGDANRMVQGDSLGARLNVEQGRKETYVVDLRVAAQMNPADLQVVDRILVHPGALIPSAWQKVERVMVPKDLEAAVVFLAKNARKGDIFLLAPDATGSVESWGNLFIRYGVLGIRTTDLMVATINQLKDAELIALLASLGPQGGLILGAEIQFRTSGERNLLVSA